MERIVFRESISSDTSTIQQLLEAAKLPTENISKNITKFFVALSDNTIIGVGGLEFYENDALLRSVAVAPQLQKNGIGSQLVDYIIHIAKNQNIKTLYLLTETAQHFFEKKGFSVIVREKITNTALQQSTEFTTACPTSAIAMQYPLKKYSVLFLCTGNSARSQMAEGILRSLNNEHYDVFSAGTHPSIVNPFAIEVMKEIGIDISSHTSKSVDVFHGKKIDIVITVCDNAKESCPVFPSIIKKLHWSFEDPASIQGDKEEKLRFFRKIRDEIKTSIEKFNNTTL